MQKYKKILLLFLLVVSTNTVIFAQLPDFFNVPRTSPIDFTRRNGCDYLIITPDDEVIKQWADTLRVFREEQGIITKVVTMQEAGPNHPDSLRAFLLHAHEEWNPAPAAVLLLGDYSDDNALGITTYALTNHPDGQQYEPYLADNKLVDFDNDGLPDMVIARMPAACGGEAQLMVQKTLNYERHPYSDEAYYNHPVTAMGYQRTRWFQLCTEVIAGYLEHHGKDVIHLNAIHQGTPDSVWSTGQKTQEVLEYFGPHGLGYIPATMSHLTDWDSDADDVRDALNNGTYLFIHRDHGTFQTWNEPYFSNDLINELHNDKLSFVMSANCQTGDFSYGSGDADCLAERFLRVHNGAVGVIAASQLSYSYVNDTYVWGFFDYLHPDFMPDYGPQQMDFQYPAFANAYGKYYLEYSSFPSNASLKTITNNLFHYFGDAYLQLYSEMPQHIAVAHPESVRPGTMSITINADDNTLLALSIDNQLIARGKTSNGLANLNFTKLLDEGDTLKVVATKQNCYRYESQILVKNNIGIDELSDNKYEIYPNPVNNALNIKGDGIYNIDIFNVLGQEITSHPIDNSDFIELDCSDLTSGVYLIKITGNNIVTRRFIKQ